MSKETVRIPDHSLNPVMNNLLNKKTRTVMLNFAKVLVATSAYLEGPGKAGLDGFPMPYAGRVIAIATYQNTTVVRTDDLGDNEFNAGDRVSVYAVWLNPVFTVKCSVNGAYLGSVWSGAFTAGTNLTTLLIELDIPQE